MKAYPWWGFQRPHGLKAETNPLAAADGFPRSVIAKSLQGREEHTMAFFEIYMKALSSWCLDIRDLIGFSKHIRMGIVSEG